MNSYYLKTKLSLYLLPDPVWSLKGVLGLADSLNGVCGRVERLLSEGVRRMGFCPVGESDVLGLGENLVGWDLMLKSGDEKRWKI